MSLDPTQYPYDTVVYITDTIGSQSLRGSGVLISPDEVLTAAHVVYTSGIGAATDVQVSPGYNFGPSSYGTISYSYFKYYEINDKLNQISASDSQYDFAVIHLSHPAPNAGYMRYESNFSGGSVHITGFPAYYGENFGNYQGMVDFSEPVTRDPQYSVFEGSSTGKGSSGGPVWVMNNGLPYVVGVVSTASTDFPGGSGTFAGISTPVYQQIQQWVYEDDLTDPLVDVDYYDARYPDVAAASFSAAYHYETWGWKEGRNPDAYFNTSGYLRIYSDVSAAEVDPMLHYEQDGWKEGRDPAANFDTEYYLVHAPDVKAAGVDPLIHYLQHGISEHRLTLGAVGHRINAVDFDPDYYLMSYADVAASGIDPYQHYLNWGWHEGRNPNSLFDTTYYLDHNPDVAAAGLNPLLHYHQYGWREARAASALFDTTGYLAANSDVAGAHIDPLGHFLDYGLYEGRLP